MISVKIFYMKEMFTTFFDYIDWRGDLSFDEAPFSEVDGVIFSQLTYINFTDIVSSDFKNTVTLKQAFDTFSSIWKFSNSNIVGTMLSENMSKLFEKCSNSKRFGNVLISGYSYLCDSKQPVQFGAECFSLNDKKKTLVIAFEGTDDSFTGWYEDFSMSYKIPSPSQLLSVSYLKKALKVFWQKREIILTGHSKGGCNAVYAAANVKFSITKKLQVIYNFDGPGFTDEILNSKGYLKIKEKIRNYYPHYSVIGQIYTHTPCDKIINSNINGIMQHDPSSWNVLGGSFVYVEDYSSESRLFAKSINKWLRINSEEDKKTISDSLFGCIYASGVNSNQELSKDKISCSKKIISAYMKLEPEQKKLVQSTIGYLMNIFKDNIPLFNLFHSKKKDKE